jgi:hypothetical protein
MKFLEKIKFIFKSKLLEFYIDYNYNYNKNLYMNINIYVNNIIFALLLLKLVFIINIHMYDINTLIEEFIIIMIIYFN